MTTTDYQPIACELYSAYEVFILRGSWLRVDAEGPDGPLRDLRCRAVDLRTRDGAEYLCLRPEDGRDLWIRLDYLRKVLPCSE